MAIAVEGIGTGAAQANPHLVPYPADIAAGDVLILSVTSATAITTPSGHSLLTTYDGGSLDVGTFEAIAAGTESGDLAVAMGTSTQTVGHLLRISGADSADPVEDYGISTSPSATGPSLTSAGEGRLLISIMHGVYSNSTARTAIPPEGMTLVADDMAQFNFRHQAVAIQEVGTGATGTKTWSVSNTSGWTRRVTNILVKPGTVNQEIIAAIASVIVSGVAGEIDAPALIQGSAGTVLVSGVAGDVDAPTEIPASVGLAIVTGSSGNLVVAGGSLKGSAGVVTVAGVSGSLAFSGTASIAGSAGDVTVQGVAGLAKAMYYLLGSPGTVSVEGTEGALLPYGPQSITASVAEVFVRGTAGTVAGEGLEFSFSVPPVVVGVGVGWQQPDSAGIFSIDYPLGIQVGDLLLAEVTSANAITVPAEWTTIQNTVGFLDTAHFWKIADSTDVSRSVNGQQLGVPISSPTQTTGHILAIRGHHPSAPIEDWDDSHSSSSMIADSVLSGGANRLLISTISKTGAASVAITKPPEMSLLSSVTARWGQRQSAVASQVIEGSGETGTRTWAFDNYTDISRSSFNILIRPAPPTLWVAAGSIGQVVVDGVSGTIATLGTSIIESNAEQLADWDLRVEGIAGLLRHVVPQFVIAGVADLAVTGVAGAVSLSGATILTPGNLATVDPEEPLTVTWSVRDQDEYRLSLLDEQGNELSTSGWVADSAAREAAIDFDWEAGVQYDVALQVRYNSTDGPVQTQSFFTGVPSLRIPPSPIDAILAPTTRWVRRVDIYDADGVTPFVLNAPVVSGNVSVDYDRNERRTLDITLDNSDGSLVIDADNGLWYDKVIKVYRGIVTDNDEWMYPLGVFHIDSINDQHFPHSIDVQARDRSKLMLVSKFTQPTEMPAGTNLFAAIRSLAANAGITQYVMPTDEVTLGASAVFDQDSSRWDGAKKIANDKGYEMFLDVQGRLVVQPFRDPFTSGSVMTFKTGQGGQLVSWRRSANDALIKNHVVVVAERSNNVPIYAEALNTEPTSPTRIARMGDRVETYKSEIITTMNEAKALAAQLLKIKALEQFDVDLGSLVLPWLEVGEVVTVELPVERAPDAPTRFLLTSLTIPLKLGPMSVRARRVTIVG